MDELKRDELQDTAESEAKDSDVSAEAEPAPADPLSQELDDLRDLFQQELDKATAEAEKGESDPADTEDEGELIQALDDVTCYDEETHTDESEPVCECCGESACSKEHGEGYPYCDSCRELMKRYPLRASGILMAVLMFAVFVLSAYFSMSYVEVLPTVVTGAQNYSEGKILSAMGEYYNHVLYSDPETVSKRAFRELFDGFKKTGFYSDAASMIESTYSEDDLKKPWNKKYSDFLEENDILVATYYATQEIVQDVLNGKEYDYDKVISELDALLTGEEEYNAVFTEYYKYVVMSLHGESLESQLEQLKKVDSMGKDLEWVYISNYCAVAAKMGDEALTKELYERAIEINKQDMNAYVAYASYYRYADTPDPDKMIEICDLAKQYAYEGDASYTQNLVIAYLLKGEAQTAFETMQSYLSANSYTVQNCNLYALCALETDNTEVYDEMIEVLESADYELSSLITKYKAGKLTLEQVLCDKGGEI